MSLFSAGSKRRANQLNFMWDKTVSIDGTLYDNLKMTNIIKVVVQLH